MEIHRESTRPIARAVPCVQVPAEANRHPPTRMAWPLLEDRAMDLVFHCASCCGVLIVREELRGLPVRCAHCADHVEAQNGQAVTEAIVSQFLDLPKPAAERRVLRRVRPAPRHSSADASH